MNKPQISDFTRKCDGPTTEFSKGKLWPAPQIINWPAYYKADWEYRQWLAEQEQIVDEFLSDYKPATEASNY